MITEKMRLREFFARLAPATIGFIAHDCGVAGPDDRVDALVAYSLKYRLPISHWHVRYPELAADRSTPDSNATARCHTTYEQSRASSYAAAPRPRLEHEVVRLTRTST